MALSVGDIGATSGMTRAIYDQLQASIEPDLPEMPPDDLEAVRDGWRKLAHAVATGVVAHLRSNLEVVDAATEGVPERGVNGSTGSDPGGGNHTHGAGSLTVTLDDLTFR